MENIPMWFGALISLFTVCGVLGTALAASAFFRGQRNKTTLELLTVSNSELQRTVQWERQECKAEIAGLRGQVDILKSGIVESMAVAISRAVLAELEKSGTMMRRHDDKPTITHTTTESVTESGVGRF